MSSLFSKFVSFVMDDKPPPQNSIMNAFINKPQKEKSESENSDEDSSNSEHEAQNSQEEEDEEDEEDDNENEEEVEYYEESQEEEEEENSQNECNSKSEKSSNDCNQCPEEEDEVDNDLELESWYWNKLQQDNQQKEIQKQLLDITLNQLLHSETQIQSHHQQKYNEVIDSIDDPQFQLDYINFIWHDISESQILVKHVELLCKHKPEQVPNFLRSGKYPIFDSIYLTKAYNIYEGTAILLEKMNKVDESIQIYLEFMDDLLKRYLREVVRLPVQISKRKKPYLIINNLSQLISTLQQLLNNMKILLDNNKLHNNIDILYFQVFNQIIDWQQMLYQAYKLDNTKIEILTIINHFRTNTPEILIKLLYSTDVELFIDELINNYSKLNLGFQFYCFRAVFLDFHCYQHILRLGNIEINKTNTLIKDILHKNRNQGKRVEIICQQCQLLGNMIIDQIGGYKNSYLQRQKMQ
ncbi:unnamed protein product (macronuclear) [Paramecium tetraurelia]|uniref:Vacuolar protein sorting-associated protein 8 central domain-containing protein n=1 Tax=Paramecium tetraurelia TaxID=5888 RepID=A0C0Q5_PARTE|nr:uncharacterized protein GSPATT00033848001 [Paramecium tetraurelia]CAK64372.1 unnamed protein product [Paramecium tetraurelia]|eukprot:XP_001431770.1 hypothetical protein (macronuclear) [Paramecium tetraurelia strain d4-2]